MQQQAAQCAGTSTISRAGISPRGSTSRRLGGLGHWRQWLAVLCLALGMAGPAWAVCPSTVNLTVPAGGRVAITCAYDWGFLEVDSANTHTTSYGQVSVIPGEVYAPEYVNTSGAGQTDDFVLSDGDTGAPVRLIITIGAATSPLTVSPATLSTPSVGVAFSQTLSTTGGTAPYTYSLGSGTLPPGITLSSGGVISGTSTQSGPHTFTIHVVDSAALSTDKTYSVTIAAPVLDLTPDAPTAGVLGVAYNLQFASSGGTAPYTYQVEGGLGTLPPGLSLSSSGLVSGTPTALGTYTFSLRHDDSTSISTGGDHFRAQMVSITINNASPPDAPTIGTATAGDTQAALTFTAPANDGGAAISGYTVTSSPGTITASGSASPITVTGLTNGIAYSFSVTATNAAGTGAASAASNSVTPKGSQTISFSNPGSQNFGTTPTLSATATSGLTPSFSSSTAGVCTITSAGALTFLTTGICTIHADQAGNGVYLAAPTVTQSFTVAAVAPGAPTIGTASAGDTQATLSFTAPPSNGGAAISGYTVTSSPGAITATGTASPITVTGLTNGIAYTFTVTATNAAGTGSASAASNSVTPIPPIPAPAVTSIAPTTGSTVGGTTVTISGSDFSGATAVKFGATNAPSYTVNSASSITATAPAASAGSVNVTVTTAGGTSAVGASSEFTYIALPVANPVSATVAYGSSANPITLNITGGTPVSVAVASAATHGTATASGTSITYTPTVGFAGSDSFTYTATNTGGTSTPATASITVSMPTLAMTPAGGTLTLAYATGYSQTFTASGGSAPYGYELSGTLPAGVSFDTTTGALSGTPTQPGNFPVSVTATDSSTGSGAPFSITQNYTLQIATPSIVLTPTSLPAGSTASVYPATGLSASGGVAPYSYAVTTGAVPAGMTLSSTGQVSGTPTAAGSFPLTVTVTDAHGQTGSRAYTLAISAPTLTLSPATLANATAETAYTQTLGASGGTAPYSYAVSSGSLPVGINLDTGTGELAGTPTVSGDFNFTVTATDSSTGNGAPFTASQSYTLHVDAPVISLTPATLPDGIAGAAYPSTTLIASGGVGPYSYTLTGTLPAGMAFDAGSATLSGTPSAVGSFSLTTTATDAHGFTASTNYALVIQAATLTLSPATLPSASAETAYSQTLTTSGGVAPYSYAITGGALPAGLSLDASTGVIAGTPTVSGSFSVDVRVTDASTGAGAPASVMRTYALVVAAPVISITPASLPAAQRGAAYSQALTASGGDGSYSFTVTTGALPAGLSLAGSGLLAGTPTVSGSFGFTVTARDGLNFTGTQAYTLTVGVATPVAVDDTASTSANQPVTIEVTGNDSGSITSIAVATAPAHGTATVDGLNVVYTPAGNFFGSDTLTYTATGAGGTSAPATVTITVTPLAIPTAVAQTATTLAGTAVTIHATQGASGGPFTAVTLASTPASGTATVAGEDIVYTPAIEAAGSVSFIYTLSNAFGVSLPAAITVQVHPVPQAAAQAVNALAGTPVQVELTTGATGGPFTAADVISIAPVAAGTAVIAASGSGADAGFRLTFTPAVTFAGVATVTYSLDNAYATSAAAVVTIDVAPRPDPSTDAEVLGVLAAQAGAARRFSSAQIGNFQQRMQGLHDGGASGSRFHNGVTFILDRRCTESEATGFGRSCATSRPADEDAAVTAPTVAATTSPTFAIWTGGALGSGDRDRSNGASALTFETSGVSAGADYRLSPAFAFGAGLGYGRDRTDVGDHGSRSDADNKTAALYASYHPGDAFYLDGLLGYQWLSFDTRRHATGTDTSVQGERDGTQWFASVAVGLDHRLEQLGISPYARLDVARARLDGYTERGAAPYALRYEAQDVDTTTGNVGLNLDYRRPVRWGTFAPKLRLEYQHDFQGAGAATMSFADLVGGPFYRATLDGFDRNRFMFGIGAALYTGHDLRLGMEYRRLFGSDNDEALLFNLEKTY